MSKIEENEMKSESPRVKFADPENDNELISKPKKVKSNKKNKRKVVIKKEDEEVKIPDLEPVIKSLPLPGSNIGIAIRNNITPNNRSLPGSNIGIAIRNNFIGNTSERLTTNVGLSMRKTSTGKSDYF